MKTTTNQKILEHLITDNELGRTICGFCNAVFEKDDYITEAIKHVKEQNAADHGHDYTTPPRPNTDYLKLKTLSEVYEHLEENIEVLVRVSGYINEVDILNKLPIQKIILESEDFKTQVPAIYSNKSKELPVGLVLVRGFVSIPEYRVGKTGKSSKRYQQITLQLEEIIPQYGDLTKQLEPQELAEIHNRIHIADYSELIEFSEETISPSIKGFGFAKTGYLATAASPIRFPLAKEDYALKILGSGKEREGKDITAENVCELCPDFVSVNSEQSSVAGLSGGIVQDKVLNTSIIKWGALPSAHRKIVHMRGISGFSPERLAELRENLASGKVRINKIKSGETPALCRMILTGNTNRRMDYYPTYYDAIRDTGCNGESIFLNAADFKRMGLVIPVIKNVSLAAKFEAQLNTATGDIVARRNSLKMLIKRAWGASATDWVWDMPALHKYAMLLADYAEKNHEIELAVFDSEGIYILSALAGGFAVISGSINSANQFEVKEIHFDWAFNYISEMCARLQVAILVENQEMLERVIDELVQVVFEIWLMKIKPEWNSSQANSPLTPNYEDEFKIAQTKWFAKTSFESMINILVELFGARRVLTWEELSEKLNIPKRTLQEHNSKFSKAVDTLFFSDYGQIPSMFEGKPNSGVVLTDFGVIFAKKLIEAYRAKESNLVGCAIARLDSIYIHTIPYPSPKKEEKKVYSIGRDNSCNRAGSEVNYSCANREKGVIVEFIKNFLQESHSFDNSQIVIGPFKYGERVNLQPKDAAFFIKNGYAESYFSETNRATSEKKTDCPNPAGASP